MATYYIDESGIDDSGRNGSVGQEWATLSYACTRVTNGDLIHINSGTYNINSRVDIPVGVSIEGDGDTSILRGNYYTASSSYGILSLYSYPTQGTNGNQSISNLKLDGQDETAYAAIVVFDRSNVKIYNITIENFEMYGIYLRGGCIPSGGFDGNIGSAPTIYESGNEIYSCILTNNGNDIGLNSQTDPLIHDNIITETKQHIAGTSGHIVIGWGQWFKGLKFYNNICTKNLIDPDGNWNFQFEVGTTHGGNEIYNNEFYNGTALDIASWENVKGDYDYSWWIHDNLFKLDRQLAFAEEAHWSYAVCLEATCEDVIINNNKIENYAWGVGLDVAQSPRHQNNIKIYYNEFINMGYSDDSYNFIFPIRSYYTPLSDNYISNIYFDNNSIYSSGNTGIFYIDSFDLITNIWIRNNIIYNSSSNYYGWLCFWDGTGTISNIYTYNNDVYNYSGGLTPYYRNGKSVTNYDPQNNITTNPLFISSSNLHLQSDSPCINAGINVNLGFDNDYNMVPYNGGIDIGAFEYGSYNQIGVSDIIISNVGIL